MVQFAARDARAPVVNVCFEGEAGLIPATNGVLRKRILAEYREMPALRLTAAQAARLWTLSSHDCEEILRTLVAAGLLGVTADRRYVAGAGLERVPRASSIRSQEEAA